MTYLWLGKAQSYRKRHYIFDFFKITTFWIVLLIKLLFRKFNRRFTRNWLLVNFLRESVMVLLTRKCCKLPTKITLNPVTKEIIRNLKVLVLEFNNAVTRATVILFDICLVRLLQFSFVSREKQRFIFLSLWDIFAFFYLCSCISAPLNQFLFEYFDLVGIKFQRVFNTFWSEVFFID